MTPTASSWGGTGGGAWIQASLRSDCVVVTVGGELDILSAAKLGKTLEQATAGSGTRCLIIDMTHLSFIDSTGLGVLIAAQNRARVLGDSVVLVHPPKPVQRLLLATQLGQRFTAYDTLDGALAALRAP